MDILRKQLLAHLEKNARPFTSVEEMFAHANEFMDYILQKRIYLLGLEECFEAYNEKAGLYARHEDQNIHDNIENERKCTPICEDGKEDDGDEEDAIVVKRNFTDTTWVVFKIVEKVLPSDERTKEVREAVEASRKARLEYIQGMERLHIKHAPKGAAPFVAPTCGECRFYRLELSVMRRSFLPQARV